MAANLDSARRQLQEVWDGHRPHVARVRLRWYQDRNLIIAGERRQAVVPVVFTREGCAWLGVEHDHVPRELVMQGSGFVPRDPRNDPRTVPDFTGRRGR